ncbi:MAG: alpha-1,2-fucosyltransferase [Sulfitobacter sp.]
MIYTRLHGGLGNQLFQYAAGRALALRHRTGLAIDDRILPEIGFRLCQQHFDWKVKTPSKLPPVKSDGLIRYGAWRLLGKTPSLRREKGLGYDASFENWGEDTYLHGYWQTERYFSAVKADIRNDLKIVTPSSTQNAEMAARITETNSVSLHVRRGDYLALAAHNVCTESYYQAALKQVVDVTETTPHVFVFSDEPKWARDNLPLDYEKTIVDFNGPETDYEDLRLMSLCQHNVIANSSFSWWGGWLNANPDKVVAGPAKWFGNNKMYNPDILPETWLRINTS